MISSPAVHLVDASHRAPCAGMAVLEELCRQRRLRGHCSWKAAGCRDTRHPALDLHGGQTVTCSTARGKCGTLIQIMLSGNLHVCQGHLHNLCYTDPSNIFRCTCCGLTWRQAGPCVWSSSRRTFRPSSSCAHGR